MRWLAERASRFYIEGGFMSGSRSASLIVRPFPDNFPKTGERRNENLCLRLSEAGTEPRI